MNNTELYINGKLVDTGGDLGVRLNRKLIDPGALNTVDAQFSYTISLPPTQPNVEAFDYSIIEETRDKFNRVYRAELIINGSRIFGPGLFRLSSVTAAGFKGQLYLPAKKTIKDIFGELKLNQNAPLNLPFFDFAEYINLYNTAAATEPQAAIFPYILYGVLPKTPLNKNANLYSARDLWDDSVRLGISDLAPAINPLIMLKHIFNSRGYVLQGSAFQDDKLTKLYQTYRNAADYVQPWNYGYHAKFRVRGGWSTRYNFRTGAEELERGVSQSADVTGPLYTCDLFDATNTSLEVVEDNGGNVLRKEINDGSGRTWLSAQIRIPTSGFYKVKLDASLRVYDSEDWRITDPATGVQHVGGRTPNAVNDFNDNIYGMRLVRDRGNADFNIGGARFAGVFYYNNQPQNQTFDGNNIPKYFPQVGDGQINFVDAAQDKNIIMGFEFGRHAPVTVGNVFQGFSIQPANPDLYNPKAGLGPNSQIVVAKPATSWDTATGNDNPTRLAIKAPGYWKYGRIGTFDNEGDNPNIDIDYSAGPFVNGKVLDENGNPIDPGLGNLDARIEGYLLSLVTGLQAPGFGWEVSEFLDLRIYDELNFSATYTIEAPEVDKAEDVTTGFYLDNTGAPIAASDSTVSYVNNYIAVEANKRYYSEFTNMGYAVLFYDAALNLLSVIGAATSAPVGEFTTPTNAAYIRYNLLTIESGARAIRSLDTETSAAIVAYYDVNLQYIGVGIAAPNTGSTATYVNEPVTPPIGAVYVRLSGQTASPLSITADSSADGNIILLRFQLARFYTYVITANNPLYNGVAYVHNGAEIAPTIAVPFVNGVAEFDTSLAPLISFDPKLTIYLKTADFDVDGTLIISREITTGSEDVIDWELTDKYKIDLNNAPANYARRGQFNGGGADANWYAQGNANAVVWLEAGELLSLASVSSEGRYRGNGMHSTYGWASHEILYDLSVEPFRVEPEWLKVDLRGNGTAAMDWNDPTSFDVDHINLVGFLSADMKTDEYIENFCKAFNLGLTQLSATTFSLDVKQSKTATSNLFIDLDKVASVKQRENTPLGLPSQYVLGFTIDPEEEGFVETGEDGGGTFSTGATEVNVVTQTSVFSYNWYKAMTKVEVGGNITINLPIISKAEVWDPAMPYPDAMKQRYTDLAQRFMYYAGILPGTFMYNGDNLQIANVSNELPGASVLNYKNKVHTILYNYFTLLINGASHYTNIKGYLTPTEYMQLNGTLSVKFNGDMYFAAELTGYDPYNKNQTTIKLIRKI